MMEFWCFFSCSAIDYDDDDDDIHLFNHFCIFFTFPSSCRNCLLYSEFIIIFFFNLVNSY